MKKRYGYCLMLVLFLVVLSSCSDKKTQEELPELIIGGTSYSPYFYRDMNGDFIGIDVDIATELCERIGYTPVFKELDSGEQYSALKDGTVDCLWCCLSIDEKNTEFVWAGPYLYTQRSVIVHVDSEIRTLADLEGKRVAVLANSTSEKIILDDLTDSIPQLEQLTVFSTMGEVFSALKKEYVDAAIGHESSLMAYAEENLEEYRFLDMSLRSEALGIAFRENDVSLVDTVNKEIQKMREDGLMEKIIKEYGLNIQKNVYGGVVNGEKETEK